MVEISTDIWFDDDAVQAVELYTSVFDNSKIHQTQLYPADSPGKEGDVMYIDFEIAGKRLGAINGGPHFKHSPAMSLVITCDSQEEVDRYWSALSSNPEAEQCGWLVDRFGVSWQVVPKRLNELMTDSDPDVVYRVAQAMFKMKKLDIAELEAAAKAPVS